jgi:[phosphatase 2A protein]-leucine-carboxy methyltransferase
MYHRDSIAKLELVDEYEELELVLAHYALAWGAKVDDGDDLLTSFTGWGLRPAEETIVDSQ